MAQNYLLNFDVANILANIFLYLTFIRELLAMGGG